MNDILNKLKRELNQGETVVVATSGGPDSMTLLYLTLKLKQELNLNIIAAHVNHNLRKESTEEQRLVNTFCAKNDIICENLTIDHYNQTNIEAQARTKRYQFFQNTVNKCKAKHLLTAHHGDDLTETILMRIVRGSNLKGYQGFQEKINKPSYIIYRPLITKTKQEIKQYADKNHIPYALDKSNEDQTYTRNRYRKNILPLLKKENKSVHLKFYKFSQELNTYQNYIDDQTTKYLNQTYKNNTLDLTKFKTLHPLIQTTIINKILELTYNHDLYKITDKHKDQILTIIKSQKPNQTVSLPNNLIAKKSYNTLQITKPTSPKPYKIPLKPTTNLPNNHTIKETQTDQTSNTIIRLNSNEIQMPLYIRTIQPGDKISLKGSGTKKINQIYIENKIPTEERQTHPILVDSQNTILWIPGLKKSKFDKQKHQNYDIILEYI